MAESGKDGSKGVCVRVRRLSDSCWLSRLEDKREGKKERRHFW